MADQATELDVAALFARVESLAAEIESHKRKLSGFADAFWVALDIVLKRGEQVSLLKSRLKDLATSYVEAGDHDGAAVAHGVCRALDPLDQVEANKRVNKPAFRIPGASESGLSTEPVKEGPRELHLTPGKVQKFRGFT